MSEVYPVYLELNYMVYQLYVLVQELELAIGDVLDYLRHLLEVCVDPLYDELHLGAGEAVF